MIPFYNDLSSKIHELKETHSFEDFERDLLRFILEYPEHEKYTKSLKDFLKNTCTPTTYALCEASFDNVVSALAIESHRELLTHKIESEEDYNNRMGIFDILWDIVGDDLSHPYNDIFETLAGVIEAYEEEHCPMPHITQGDMLKYLMEKQSVTIADLKEILTQTEYDSLIQDELSLSESQIDALSAKFHVSPKVFKND